MTESDSTDDGVPGTTFTYDPGEHPSTAVVSAVAAVLETDTGALPPLYDVVDGDRLDSVLRPNDPLPDDSPVCVGFRYAGCEVTVDSHGRITVVPDDSDPATDEE